MTVKKYLEQDIRLDERILEEKQECQRLREMAQSLKSPSLQGRVDGSQSNEAPFVKELEKLAAEEKRLEENIKKMVALKVQINQVIGQVKDPLNRRILRMRYMQGKSWDEIGKNTRLSVRPLHYRCIKAQNEIVLPSDAINLYDPECAG